MIKKVNRQSDDQKSESTIYESKKSNRQYDNQKSESIIIERSKRS